VKPTQKVASMAISIVPISDTHICFRMYAA